VPLTSSMAECHPGHYGRISERRVGAGRRSAQLRKVAPGQRCHAIMAGILELLNHEPPADDE
jgi:hypothetical protein